jgi:hypothetical protein
MTLLPEGGSPLTFRWDSTEVAYTNAITLASFTRTYDLDTITSTSWPAFGIEDFFLAPPTFTVTSPAIDAASPPRVYISDLRMRWTGSPADRVIIYLGMMNSTDTAYQEEVACVVNDDGSFDVPTTVWTTTWPTNARTLYIGVGRIRESVSTLPTTRGDVRTQGEYWVYGAAATR